VVRIIALACREKPGSTLRERYIILLFGGSRGAGFFGHDADRGSFVERLGRVVSDTGAGCFAWALMPNHAHLLLRTGRTPIAVVMRRVLTGYAVCGPIGTGFKFYVFVDAAYRQEEEGRGAKVKDLPERLCDG
jgi:hypothetical protein